MINKLLTDIPYEGGGFEVHPLTVDTLAAKLNEIIDVVNTITPSCSGERVPVGLSQDPLSDRIFQARQQEYAKSVHAQTFGLGDPEE